MKSMQLSDTYIKIIRLILPAENWKSFKKKKKTKILVLKNVVTEISNSQDEFHSRLERAKRNKKMESSLINR